MKLITTKVQPQQLRVEHWDKKLSRPQSPPRPSLKAAWIKRRLPTLKGQAVERGVLLEPALGGNRWVRVPYQESERVYRHLEAVLPLTRL